MESKNYRIKLSCLRSTKIGTISAYLLLFLLIMTFALENHLFFESDVIELVEFTEKDSDAKEKKLLFRTDISIKASAAASRIKSYLSYKELMPKNIYLERQTPPPEFM